MSIYFIKGKGWRYDFTQNEQRHTKAWFKTKKVARQAEAEKRKEVKRNRTQGHIRTDMGFLELINRRLDHVETRNSKRHYDDYRYLAKRWMRRWGHLQCSGITQDMIEAFVNEHRKAVSAWTGNKEIRFLRATFNFGQKRKWLTENPVQGIEFFPVDKKSRYVPDSADIDKVISVAKSDEWLLKRYSDTADYLETIRETLARMSEINRLEWEDVNLNEQYLILYTRKIDGSLTPRKVPMTNTLCELLLRRFAARDQTKPWVFWNPRTDRPYQDRKKIMKRLCSEAGVKYLRFHPLRHAGASLMDRHNVPKGSIQRILGHKQRTTTDIYLHAVGNAEREAMNTFEQARQESHTESHTKMT